MSEPEYFDYHEVRFVSDTTLQILYTIQSIINLFTICVYLLLVYVVLIYSPKAVGTYK